MMLCALALGLLVGFLVLRELRPDFWAPAPWFFVVLLGVYVTCLVYLSLPHVKQAFGGR
jgi:hypothetical protein